MKCVNPILKSVKNTPEFDSSIRIENMEINSLYLSFLVLFSYLFSIFIYKRDMNKILSLVLIFISLGFMITSLIYLSKNAFKLSYSIVFCVSIGLFFGFLGRYLEYRLSQLSYNDGEYVNNDSVIFITIFSSIILTSAVYSVYYCFFNNIRIFSFIYPACSLLTIIISVILIYLVSNVYASIDLIKNNLAAIITILLVSFVSFMYHEEARIKIDNYIAKEDILKISTFINSCSIFFIIELVNIIFTRKNSK